MSDNGGREPHWQLFDLATDYAQKNNVVGEHPDAVQALSSAFDQWWMECLPLMVNEQVVGPEINPFQELYYQQFGGSPTPEDLERMKPNRASHGGASKPAKK